jgi:GT2 family glycosyltransferase
VNAPDFPQVAVLIVCFNGRDYIRECLSSVLASDDGPIGRHVVVVDNASTDGSDELIAAEFPQVNLVRSDVNGGFAGGNNLGWQFIRSNLPRVRFIALLNQDTIAVTGWLRALGDYLDGHPIAGAVQSKVLLHPETHLLNTAGNASHFLGFGFTTGYRQPDDGRFDRVRSIDFASGAAMMVRVDAISPVRDVAPFPSSGTPGEGQGGGWEPQRVVNHSDANPHPSPPPEYRRREIHGDSLFDETMFAYLEDAELSWRLRQLGYDIVYVPTSVVQHKYRFAGDYRNYYLLERNRWLLLATYYRTGTFLLLLPALLAMEGGQVYFSWRHGVLREKLRAWRYFTDRRNLARLIARRNAAQRRRVIGDRAFTAHFIAEIEFTELKSRVLRWVANPVLKCYWRAMKALVAW